LSEAEIAARPPEDGADTLYTRLRGDRDVRISKRQVIERAPDVLAALRADGCAAIVFACTGDFPPMPGDASVVFPSRILNALVGALLSAGRLGLLIPLPEQAAKLKSKWARPGLEIVAEALAPSADTASAALAARRLAAHAPNFVAMDCMSYTPETKEAVKRVVGVPTLLAVTATGRVVEEILG
jgi:protein AroM